jgi:DNA gyrase subunit A
MKDEDYIEHLLVASTHDTVLCFTSAGKVYWLKVYELPQASRGSKGKPIVNILPLVEGERITTILPLREYPEGHYVFMATGDGTVKKVEAQAFSRQRTAGLIAIDLVGDDVLVGAAVTDGNQDIMLFSNEGKAVRFHESDVRCMGRTAMGVRGIRLGENASVVSLIVANPEAYVLTASANGFGKRTAVTEFPTHKRGGQGVIAMQTSDRNGELIGAVQVVDSDELMLISNQGTLVRTRISEVSVLSRNTQGVTLIKLGKEESLVRTVRVDEIEDDGFDDDGHVIDVNPVELPTAEVSCEDVSATDDSQDPAADDSASDESAQ